MKTLISFLSYHNAVPAALVALALGAGGALAATSSPLVLSPQPAQPSVSAEQSAPAAQTAQPQSVDARALIGADLDAFDFNPTVTAVDESTSGYAVSYRLSTLAPVDGAWIAAEKTGEFSVAKDALEEGGLNAYVARKLRDIQNGERSYLSRAQAAERSLAQKSAAEPARTFSALVGLALDQIPVPIIQKPAAPTPPPVAVIVLAEQTPSVSSDSSIPDGAASSTDTDSSPAAATTTTVTPSAPSVTDATSSDATSAAQEEVL